MTIRVDKHPKHPIFHRLRVEWTDAGGMQKCVMSGTFTPESRPEQIIGILLVFAKAIEQKAAE